MCVDLHMIYSGPIGPRSDPIQSWPNPVRSTLTPRVTVQPAPSRSVGPAPEDVSMARQEASLGPPLTDQDLADLARRQNPELPCKKYVRGI